MKEFQEKKNWFLPHLVIKSYFNLKQKEIYQILKSSKEKANVQNNLYNPSLTAFYLLKCISRSTFKVWKIKEAIPQE